MLQNMLQKIKIKKSLRHCPWDAAFYILIKAASFYENGWYQVKVVCILNKIHSARHSLIYNYFASKCQPQEGYYTI